MLNQILLPSKFSMAVIHVPYMDMSDLYIDYLLYNKETKLYIVPVSLSENLYKETHKDDIHKIIPGANIVNYISIDEYYFDQEHWNSWLYEMLHTLSVTFKQIEKYITYMLYFSYINY